MEDLDPTLEGLLREVVRPPDLPFVEGARLGRFEILRVLGHGGFGVVYEALDTELTRHVALKVLRGGPDAELRLRLLKHEAQSAARLAHPNIVTTHDVGMHEGAPYLVLELLSGETLARRLARGALAAGDALGIFEQVARGLVHAHAAGVIHRDLKPSNIFLGADGRARILDFGIARSHVPWHIGSPLLAAGTPAYMAPEQARREVEDARVDIYSLGKVLGESVADAPELHEIVARAVAEDPNDRYQSAQELLGALLAASRGGAPRVIRRSDGQEPASDGRMMSVVLAGAASPRAEDALVSLGARVERGSDGSLVATTAATDQAARCALALCELSPGSALAVATGREPLERARALLARRHRADPDRRRDRGLLGARFEIGGDEAGSRWCASARRRRPRARCSAGPRPSPGASPSSSSCWPSMPSASRSRRRAWPW